MIINEKQINGILSRAHGVSLADARRVLKKAKKLKGLSLRDAGVLINAKSPEFEKELFKTAARAKDKIYGERLVFFAPLYVSDFCVNDCQYCSFHQRNKTAVRKRLSLKELREEVKLLIDMGHKRLLLEFGEHPAKNNINYVVKAIKQIYSVKTEKGNIRRININIAATTTANYRKLKKANIGTYQLFQETYHRQTYEKLHKGPKRNYDRQITAHIRAFKAGIDDLGLGVLFGLYDWRFELLALLQHAQYLDKNIGVGPHTISVPRFCPAPGVDYKPEHPVSDKDFLKLIAILRLAVPYTGMIISTRENAKIRKTAFKIGISQTSACSATSVGGYAKARSNPQFQIHDERTLKEIIGGVLGDKLLPSFCTACYRVGRTGERFMGLSKTAQIHNFCRPNGLLTLAEYLEDFADGEIYKKGYEAINFYLDKIKDKALHKETHEKLLKIKQGKRDLYF